MKFFAKLKKVSRKIAVASAITATVAGIAAFSSGASAEVNLNTGSDCDMNAVVYCGAKTTSSLIKSYNDGTAHNGAGSIHNIYDYFGISSSEVKAMGSTAVAGTVTKSGDVYVGSQLVATNAVTAGRQYIAGGSTQVSHDGTTFYTRKPSVSFRSSSLSAYVVMQNGKFSFAVIGSCGNPVKATPKTPNYSVTKDVRVKGTSTWYNTVTVKSGTHVEYRVTVKSTGAVAAVNITAKDPLPANVSYVTGTLARDGSKVSGNNFFTSTGDKIASLAPGKAVVYTFEAIIGSKDTVDSCTAQSITNTGTIMSPGLPTDTDTAHVNKTCIPKPTAQCTGLTLTLGDDRTVTAKLSYKTSGSSVTVKNVAYDFGDSSQVVNTKNTTVTHTYAKDGAYTVKAVVSFSATAGTVADSHCQAQIGINTPAYSCDLLHATQGDNRSVTMDQFQVSANGGATFQSAVINWGDNTPASDALTTVEGQTHSYAADGTYTITATATFMVNGKAVTAPVGNCTANVSFTAPPTELVNTGAGNIFGLVAAATIAGVLAHRLFLARKLNRQ